MCEHCRFHRVECKTVSHSLSLSVLGRLLAPSLFVLSAGIGTGAGSSIFGFLTRSTAPKDRATVFAAVMACRQAGLLIGQLLPDD